MARRVTKQIQVTVHGGTFSDNQRRPIKDLDYDAVDFYREGRNEPVPPDANIVSAVKARKKSYVCINTIEKTDEEREETEKRVFACISNASRKIRTIPIPACDPVNLFASVEENQELLPPVCDRQNGVPEQVHTEEVMIGNWDEIPEQPVVQNGDEHNGIGSDTSDISEDNEIIMELPLFVKHLEILYYSYRRLPSVFFERVLNANNILIKSEDPAQASDVKALHKKMKEFYSGGWERSSKSVRPLKLVPGAFYVYCVKMVDGRESFARAQLLSTSEEDGIRVFLCDYGMELIIETVEDLYPLRQEWTRVPQLCCWAQVGQGSSYLNDEQDAEFIADHQDKSLKIFPLGTKAVLKYTGPNEDPVSVQCCRVRVIRKARDFLDSLHEA